MKKNDNILLVDRPSRSANLRYATKFNSEDPIVLLKRGGRISIVVPPMERERVSRACPLAQVYTPRDLGIARKSRRRISNWAVYLLRREEARRVVVPPDFPVAVADRIRKKGFGVSVAAKEIFPERAIKSADEINCIRQAQQAGVFAVRAAADMLRKSRIRKNRRLEYEGNTLTSENLRKEVMKTLLNHNCTGQDIIIAPGKQAADPHEAGYGPIEAGQGIVLDIFPRHMEHGYWGDISRTLAKGETSPEYTRMYHAVKAAHQAALERVRPGVKCSTVHNAAASELQQRGFRTELRNGRPHGFIHSTGHGVGLDIHENPSVSLNDTRLKKGNVITIEPGLYYPEIGGVRIEDTVEVTSDGWRYLVTCEKKLQV